MANVAFVSTSSSSGYTVLLQAPGKSSIQRLCSTKLPSSLPSNFSCEVRQIASPTVSSYSCCWSRRRPHRNSPGALQHPPRANAETTTVSEAEEEALSPEEEDQANVQDILRVLDLLERKRDMPFNEVRLTVSIEDPIEEEQREEIGVENERGCSREDMAAVLLDVYEGRMPSDRVALREVAKEMLSWPNLEDEIDSEKRSLVESPYAKATKTGVDPKIAAQKLDWDSAAEIVPGKGSEDIVDVPPAVGFSVLYLVSAIPFLIGLVVVVILFLNSFR